MESNEESPADTDEPMAGPIPELDALGVRYHMEYGAARARFINNIQIPWTAVQWVGVIHREGEWLGTCCGTISAIRDHLMSAMANGGWVSPSELQGIIDLLKSHDGFMDWFEPGFTPDDDTLTNPLYLLVRMWDAVKGRRWASWMDVPTAHSPERRQELSGHSLEKALRLYNIVEMFHSSGGYQDTEEGRKAARRSQFSHNVQSQVAMARVLPALQAFTESLKWKALLPIQGFGLVRKSDREVVLDTVGGPAIYSTREEALEIIGFWCTNDQDKAPKADDFEIRPLEVSKEHGIKFMEESAS